MIQMALLTLSCAPLISYSSVITANQDGALGLYQAGDFQVSTGVSANTQSSIPQAIWYVQQELIATYNKPLNLGASFSNTEHAQQDIKTWLNTATIQDFNAPPPFIWLGSSQVIPQAKISEDGQSFTLTTGENLAFNITPKISTNLSYWNADTLKFFSQRDVKLRGELYESTWTARTVWPLDYSLSNTFVYPLNANENLKSLVQFEHGGAKSNFESRLLWERTSGVAQKTTGKALLGVMLNGAQGDDDESLGGHFGIVTGRMEGDGNMSRWLVNNYYNLASNSEKGIIAAVTPMDKYLMDLNNGQSYYRPSYMLVAVLNTDLLPNQVQAASNRVFNHFYKHDFEYDLSQDNCAGISMDTLHSLGWDIPKRGVTSRFRAIAAYFYKAATSLSLTEARAVYDYLNTETTRLLPAVAFDAIGNDLLKLAHQLPNNDSPFAKQLSSEIESIYFVRIPQIPSSRIFGAAPVYSFDEYLKTTPANHADWKVIPTTSRIFPENLRNGLALQANKTALLPCL